MDHFDDDMPDVMKAAGRALAAALICVGCSRGGNNAPPPNDGTGRDAAGAAGSAVGLAGAGDPGGGSAGGAPDGATGGDVGADAGNGGMVGGSGGSTALPSDTGSSVLERNKHASRDGLFLQPLLTKVKAAAMTQDAAFKATFAGAMWASPLYLENGPNQTGVFFAATTNNTVYALDETTGATVWMTTIGPPAAQPGVPCGDIHPIGILGTPVVDGKTRTLYVVGNMGPGTTTRFEVHALSVDDGKERTGWPVTLDGLLKSGDATLTFNAGAENQRGALSLVNGVLYVPFGGSNGDCGPYHGWVVAIDTANPKNVGGWATRGAGEAIWAAGGMVSDGNGVIAVTGNANGGGAQHLDAEEVVRITGMGTVERTDANVYFPSRWRTLDAADDDFGASSPVIVTGVGAPSVTYVVATTKDGHMYFLNASNLGGMDGHIADHVVAGVSHSVRTAHTAYVTALGAHVALTVDDHAVCPAGGEGAGGPVLMSVLVPPGGSTKPQTVWCAPVMGFIGTGGTHRTSAPITTTSDGQNDAVVWVVSGGMLLGVDGDTGKTIYTGGSCTNVRQWTSPIAVKGRIIAGGDGHLCAWGPR